MFVEVTRIGRISNKYLIPLESIVAIEEYLDTSTLLYVKGLGLFEGVLDRLSTNAAEAYRKPTGDIEVLRVSNTYSELKFLMMANPVGHLNPKENNVKEKQTNQEDT